MEGAAAPATSTRALTFRSDIAGLRAVAVGLVVLLHAGVTSVSGGFVGVDVFFVISGFLITSLLLAEVGGTGRVSIVSFYARRARRILPAACFVIAVTVIAVYLQLGPIAGRRTAIDGKWAAVFAANIHFISQGTDYFARDLPPSPLQHYWSLAVEEQFYLVWPTLIFGLVLIGRKVRAATWPLVAGIAGIVALSLWWSIHTTASTPTTAYFSTLTRAWELGAGALLAVFSASIARIPSRARAVATWLGLGLIVLAAFTFSSTTVFPGYAALLPIAGSILVIGGGIGQPRGGASVVLGLRPMQWLGLISFSVYLWHWPVLTIADERAPGPMSNAARVACVLLILALSIASYYLIEYPLHATGLLKGARTHTVWSRSWKALAAGAAAVLLAIGVATVTDQRAVSAIEETAQRTGSGDVPFDQMFATAGQTLDAAALETHVNGLVGDGLNLREVPSGLNPPIAKLAVATKYSRCLISPSKTDVAPCEFGSPTSKRTLLVFGDSHAMVWMPALDAFGQQHDYHVLTLYKAACPLPMVDLWTSFGRYPNCMTWKQKVLSYINTQRPDVIVIGFGRELTSSSALDGNKWLRGLKSTVDDLAATGVPVVDISNNPYLPEDPALCLSRPNADPSRCEGSYQNVLMDKAEAAIMHASGVGFVDVSPWFCVDNHCPVIIDSTIVYRDTGHITPQYIRRVAPLLTGKLVAAGF